MQTFSGFRSLSPSYAVLVQCEIFCPSHLPFGDACIFPLSLSYDPLPLQNLASHNLVSRRQSVVVLTVKMVYDLASCRKNLYGLFMFSVPRKQIPNAKPKCKTHAIAEENGQNLYPFSDQKSSKTIPFGTAHPYVAHLREYHPTWSIALPGPLQTLPLHHNLLALAVGYLEYRN